MRKIALFTLSLAPLVPAMDLFGASAFFLGSVPVAAHLADLRQNLMPPPSPVYSESLRPIAKAPAESCYFGIWADCTVRPPSYLKRVVLDRRALGVERRLRAAGFKFAPDFDVRGFSMTLLEAERLYGVPHELLIGVAATESAFNPRAVSHMNARGIFQILPTTAAFLWPSFTKTLASDDPVLGLEPLTDLDDMRLSTLMGAFYIRYLADMFDGRTHLALASYNAGPATVQKALGSGHIVSSEYVYKVSAIMQEFRSPPPKAAAKKRKKASRAARVARPAGDKAKTI